MSTTVYVIPFWGMDGLVKQKVGGTGLVPASTTVYVIPFWGMDGLVKQKVGGTGLQTCDPIRVKDVL